MDDFTKADLFQLVRVRFKQPDNLDGPLSVLTAHHYLRVYVRERPPGARGPNNPRYEVSPRWKRAAEDTEDTEETAAVG